MPPHAGTRYTTELKPLNRMPAVACHAPLAAVTDGGTSQIPGVDPPATGTRLSFPAIVSKNAIDVLSGDQKGAEAFIVPGNAAAVVESSRRRKRRVPPSSLPTNTTEVPSGDRAKRK